LKVTAPPGAKGALINFGTWQSAIYGFAMAAELKDLRKKLFPQRLPAMKPRLASKGVLHKSGVVSFSFDNPPSPLAPFSPGKPYNFFA
jgi:hypothetical protein